MPAIGTIRNRQLAAGKYIWYLHRLKLIGAGYVIRATQCKRGNLKLTGLLGVIEYESAGHELMVRYLVALDAKACATDVKDETT
jgi:hypothetical protein